MQFLGREGAMYAIFGKRRSYEEEVEKRTLRIKFARKAFEISTMPFFGKRLCLSSRSDSQTAPNID
jgi:hypothetical protein